MLRTGAQGSNAKATVPAMAEADRAFAGGLGATSRTKATAHELQTGILVLS